MFSTNFCTNHILYACKNQGGLTNFYLVHYLLMFKQMVYIVYSVLEMLAREKVKERVD